MPNSDQINTSRRRAVPRGLSATGPILFSYGFRPFFLGSAVWAICAMTLWILALTGRIDLAETYGPHAWHAHEMLFGFASAVLAGFLLTAVPNWTGRLPVSGKPLMILFGLWLVGRFALLLSDLLGTVSSAVIDALFLPTLLFICMREIVAGKKWSDLKVVGGVGVLALANICYHIETIRTGAPDFSLRFAISAYIALVMVIGGRIIPSFTRNWLAKRGATRFPIPFGRFDTGAIIVSVAALLSWSLLPDVVTTSIFCAIASLLQLLRLYRWRGWATVAEPLVAILHIAYLFVPLGFLVISMAAGGLFETAAAIHVLTIGTISIMMLAVMTRATRGHTGRELCSSTTTNLAYMSLLVCAIVRPLTAALPDYPGLLYAVAGISWIGAFSLFVFEYGPMLIAKRRQSIGAP